MTLTSVPANTPVTAVDWAGRTVLRLTSLATAGDVKVNVSGLSASDYYLKLGNGERKALKICKQ